MSEHAAEIDAVWWPQGDLLERRAIFVYECARMQAVAVGAPIVPEPWPSRDEAFRAQFLNVIAMMCGPDRKASPEELHDDWVRAYEAMGWRYGETRDPQAKTHPDMVPFGDLTPKERDKDAVFVALCELSRQWVIEYPEGECGSCGESPEGECPESKRPCGHHCNHVWTHDVCDWCGIEFGEDTEQVSRPGSPEPS